MTLEPVSAAAPLWKIEYVCPMHPEIVKSEPGSCPICGIALEPRTGGAGRREKPRTGGHDAVILGGHDSDHPCPGSGDGRVRAVFVLAYRMGVAENQKAETMRTHGQTVMFVVVENKVAGLLGVADPIKQTTRGDSPASQRRHPHRDANR